jgi:pyruvate-ferredoxin/flavodoxin oxidoreductase
MTEEKRAVECGYWNLFRYNPAAQGKKFTLDFKNTKPENYQEFLDGEVRYMSLKKSNPANADRMYAENAQNAKDHLAYLERLVSMYDSTNE